MMTTHPKEFVRVRITFFKSVAYGFQIPLLQIGTVVHFYHASSNRFPQSDAGNASATVQHQWDGNVLVDTRKTLQIEVSLTPQHDVDIVDAHRKKVHTG